MEHEAHPEVDSRSSYTILFVENDPALVRVLRSAFLSSGYRLRFARDGNEALSELNRCLPNLVITDVEVPKMDGLELCRTLRGLFSISVIIMSAKTDPQLKAAALQAGAEFFVCKPLDIRNLRESVRACLEKD